MFWWDGEAELKPLGDIEGMKVSNKKWAKPEALLPLDADGDGLSVLVLFDGAPAKSAARADTIPNWKPWQISNTIRLVGGRF